MATVSMPHFCNQSANACKSEVKVGNVRTDSESRSTGTPTTTSVAPTSIPAALGFSTGKVRSNFPCFALFRFAMPGLLKMTTTSQVYRKEKSLKRDHLHLLTIERHQCYCLQSGVKLLNGLGKQAPLGTRPTLTVAVSAFL